MRNGARPPLTNPKGAKGGWNPPQSICGNPLLRFSFSWECPLGHIDRGPQLSPFGMCRLWFHPPPFPLPPCLPPPFDVFSYVIHCGVEVRALAAPPPLSSFHRRRHGGPRGRRWLSSLPALSPSCPNTFPAVCFLAPWLWSLRSFFLSDTEG